jgi:hypothetical protein
MAETDFNEFQGSRGAKVHARRAVNDHARNGILPNTGAI